MSCFACHHVRLGKLAKNEASRRFYLHTSARNLLILIVWIVVKAALFFAPEFAVSVITGMGITFAEDRSKSS